MAARERPTLVLPSARPIGVIDSVLAHRAPYHSDPVPGRWEEHPNERLEQDCPGQGEQEQD
jgi:hypothetical protein